MRKKTAKSFQPSLQALEQRLTRSVTVQNGDLVVVGSELNDSVIIYKQISGNSYDVYENGIHSYVPVSAVTGGDIRFTGNGGDDYFNFEGPLNVWADGGLGNDKLYGRSSLTSGHS